METDSPVAVFRHSSSSSYSSLLHADLFNDSEELTARQRSARALWGGWAIEETHWDVLRKKKWCRWWFNKEPWASWGLIWAMQRRGRAEREGRLSFWLHRSVGCWRVGCLTGYRTAATPSICKPEGEEAYKEKEERGRWVLPRKQGNRMMTPLLCDIWQHLQAWD